MKINGLDNGGSETLPKIQSIYLDYDGKSLPTGSGAANYDGRDRSAFTTEKVGTAGEPLFIRINTVPANADRSNLKVTCPTVSCNLSNDKYYFSFYLTYSETTHTFTVTDGNISKTIKVTGRAVAAP